MWISDSYSRVVSRFASTFNLASGTGTPRDQTQHSHIAAPIRLSREEKYWMYQSSKIIQNIVDVLPDQYLASFIGWDFPGISDIDITLAEAYTDWMDTYDAFNHIHECLVLARLTGNGYLVLDVDDGLDPDQPLGDAPIRNLIGMRAFGQDELEPCDYIKREPEFYQFLYFQKEDGLSFTNPIKIHASRIIKIAGVKKYGQYNNHETASYRDYSVLQAVVQDFMNWDASKSDIRNMLSSASTYVLKKNGLGQALKADSSGVFDRLTSLMLGLNVMKILAIDGNSEELEIINRNFTNIDKLINAITELLISSTGLPRYKILGTTVSSGFTESGNSERNTYQGIFELYVKKTVNPLFKRFTDISKMIIGCPIFEEPNRIIPKFKSTFELDPFEKAELYKRIAEGDAIYHGMSVLDEYTIGISRFGGDEFGREIRIEDESYFENLRRTPEGNNGTTAPDNSTELPDNTE